MSRTSLREHALPAVLVSLILAATAFAALALHGIENKRSRDVRDQREARATEVIRRAFGEPLAGLEQVALGIAAGGPPSRPEFDLLTKLMLRRPEVSAVGYIERVTEGERPKWERDHGFPIKVSGAGPERAPARPVHYVVAAVSSRTGVQPGTDLGAETSRVAAMQGAVAGGQPVLTPPVPLFGQDAKGRQQIVAFEAVPSSSGRRLVSAAITFDLLDASLQQALPPGTAVAIDDGDAPLIRIGRRSGTWRRSSLPLGGRELRVRLDTADVDGSPWDELVLLVGFLIAAGAGSFAVSARRRERVIAAEVDARLSERNAVEADLARERGFSATLLSAMPDGLIAADNRGLIVVNDAMCALTGFTRKELLGRLFPYGFWPEESLNEVARLQDRVAEIGAGEMELTLRTKDDRRIPVLVSASSVEGTHGTIRIGVVRDNRERAATAARLAESEAALRQLADAAPDIVARLSVAERIEWISPSVEPVLGFAPDELTGHRFSDLFENQGAGQLGPTPQTLALKRKDGRAIWTETTVTPTVDEAGAVTGMHASIRDVTDRETARAASARSEQRYRLLARSLPDTIVFMIDADRRFVIAEGGGLDGTGWTSDMVEGRTVDEVLTDPAQQALLPFYDAVLAGRDGEISHTSNQGRDYLTRFVALRAADGTVEGALVVASDVTALRDLQAAAARSDTPV